MIFLEPIKIAYTIDTKCVIRPTNKIGQNVKMINIVSIRKMHRFHQNALGS